MATGGNIDRRIIYTVLKTKYTGKKEVNDFIREHNLPYNSLLDKGFTSIGCDPCTVIPPDPNDERSGRWCGTSNQGGGCGIHEGEGN